MSSGTADSRPALVVERTDTLFVVGEGVDLEGEAPAEREPVTTLAVTHDSATA